MGNLNRKCPCLLAAHNDQARVSKPIRNALFDSVGIAQLSALPRILPGFLGPGYTHQTAEQVARRCLFFRLEALKLGLGPPC